MNRGTSIVQSPAVTQGPDFTNRVCSREYVHGLKKKNTDPKGKGRKKNMKIHNPQHALIKQSNTQFIIVLQLFKTGHSHWSSNTLILFHGWSWWIIHELQFNRVIVLAGDRYLMRNHLNMSRFYLSVIAHQCCLTNSAVCLEGIYHLYKQNGKLCQKKAKCRL